MNAPVNDNALIIGGLITVAYIALIWLIAQVAGFNNLGEDEGDGDA